MNGRKKQILNKKHKVFIWISIIFAIIIACMIFYETHKIETVIVEGNVHYSEDEIKNFVIKENYPDNSLYLSLKYKDYVITDIPFIERLEVTVEDSNTVRIVVYEKLIAGYVTYLGENIFFDKDGIVVECSNLVPQEVPHITGLNFSHMVLYDELQVEDEEVFSIILELTKNLKKYQLNPTEIYFTPKQEITFFFEEVRIEIGQAEYLDEKLGFIVEILPDLIGKKGEISLKNYDGETSTITFRED